MKKIIGLVLLIFLLTSCDNKIVKNELNIVKTISGGCQMANPDGCGKPLIYNKNNINKDKWNQIVQIFDIDILKNVEFPGDQCNGCFDGIDRWLTISYKGDKIVIANDNGINYDGIKGKKEDVEKSIQFLKLLDF